MRVEFRRKGGTPLRMSLLLAFMLVIAFSVRVHAANLPGLTVMGVDAAGNTRPITAYRWLVEEDKTYHVQTTVPGGPADPTTFDPNWDQANDGIPGGETLSVGFHRSYMPLVAKGCVGFADIVTANPSDSCAADVLPAGGFDPSKNYYVSVVPRSGASIGGAVYVPGVGATVYVNEHPIPTAQITIFVFEDNNPINNAPDMPQEDPALNGGDMSGFTVILEDAGGRYGASAGIQTTDAFGNPLGTTYDAAGNPNGFEPLITGPDGRLTIKNLAPGKYGIQAVPPGGQGWQQTTTIEGTKVIDAWVKANEPPFFAELGVVNFHVFIGFVKPFNAIPVTDPPSTTTITGTIVNQHQSRPPGLAFYNGACFGHTTPWVGLNDMAGGIGSGIYAAATDANCNFSIPNVPDGSYQLVVWDNNLDLIISLQGIIITNGACNALADCNLGEVPVLQWFNRQEHRVFDDLNANGIWDNTEGPSALEQTFNLRWRDGTIYQSNVSDGVGAFAFDQVFPFFSWLVAEIDFARFQATGVTVVVDNGGPIPAAIAGSAPYDDNDITFGRALNPQNPTNPRDPECTLGVPGDPATDVCNEGRYYRVEHGPTLTQGWQGFAGQTNAFLWGKRHYPDLCEDGVSECTSDADCVGIGPTETCSLVDNGGISGIVFYAVTRAENDPELAGAEVWEPGIPGVTVNLYESLGIDPATGVAIKGALLNTTTTDSWDDSIPTGCKYGNGASSVNVNGTQTFFAWSPDGNTFYPTDCFDGLRNFNQARPAVFDGGYAFDAICDDIGGMQSDGSCTAFFSPMPVGDYIVEVIPPPGYEILKPENKNVDFGDTFVPAPALLAPPCVGELHLVPPFLTFFPDEQIPAPFAGTERALCDSKLVTLSTGANAAADFFLFTEVPIAAHGFGSVLDDLQNETNPNSPLFGEKYAQPFLPIVIRDWTGRTLGRTLADQYGRYNFLAPSTISTNLPAPSGMSPNMLTVCMNDPGDDVNNPDPNWNPQYSTFCYTLQFMPGVTTYLDTPIVPLAAFAGPAQFQPDCEYPDGSPRIYSVDVQTNGVGGGPYIPTSGYDSKLRLHGDHTITITSMGTVSVTNPSYCDPAAGACPVGADTVNRVINRNYGFGAIAGSVTLEDLPLTNVTWSDTIITATVPASAPINTIGSRQLTVTRANGQSTRTGVTVQVGLRPGSSVVTVAQGESIQTAIDAANANDLILIQPGLYNEMIVMWKPVQLQGWGAGSTVINAIQVPTGKLQDWRNLVDTLYTAGSFDLAPGQLPGFLTEEGAGILVLAKEFGPTAFDYQVSNGHRLGWRNNQGARIDGFTINNSSNGGGIVVNGYGDNLNITNNRIALNSGVFGGGIRVGHPELVDVAPPGTGDYADSNNDFVSIHHNQVIFNGGLGGAGGGISMCTGSDFYQITQNWVCGNFSQRDGGGIGHVGLSDNALIANNTIIFNESFFQGETVSGGGIFISGTAPLIGNLSSGTGNVQVLSNLIQGNSAGAGDGGGIRLSRINGTDVAAQPADPDQWYSVDLFNNMIVNNIAGLAGGGISLQDAVNVNLVHNTIANNDSLATAGEAFAPGSPNQSTPQPGAGIVARSHSEQLTEIPGAPVGTFSDPRTFADNIIWQNRQFYYWIDTAAAGLCPDLAGTLACPTGNTVVFDDVAVLGTTGVLSGTTNLLTPAPWTPPGPLDPSTLFVAEYFNVGKSSVAIQVPAAGDEGGNFIRPSYGPLALFNDTTPNDGVPGILFGNYHILTGSDAHDGGTLTTPATDIDGDNRTASPDIGADEAIVISPALFAPPLPANTTAQKWTR